jgi:hypothetical protein
MPKLVEKSEAADFVTPPRVESDNWCRLIPEGEPMNALLSEGKAKNQDATPFERGPPPSKRLSRCPNA